MARNGTEQVRQLQRALYRTAKQSKAVKFYSLYDKVWRTDVLREAWKQVQANRGAPGVDGESIEGIVSGGEEELMLSRLQQELRAKTYRFQPVRRVDIVTRQDLCPRFSREIFRLVSQVRAGVAV
jgi:retron-type reverse transcriptase